MPQHDTPEFPATEDFQPASPVIARQYTPRQLQPPPQRRVTRREERARARARGEAPRFRFLSCRTIGCLFLLLLCSLVFAVVYLVIVRPPAVMNPLKHWLNAGVEAQPALDVDPTAVLAGLNAKVKEFKVGENKFTITETELRVLASERLQPVVGQAVYLDVAEGRIRLYWNADRGSATPVWLAVDFEVQSQTQVVLTRVGTMRIAAPDFVNQALTRLVLSTLDRQEGATTQNANLLNLILPFPENVTITNVQISADKFTVTLNVQTGLDGIFE